MPKSSKFESDEIIHELQRITRILAVIALREHKTTSEKVAALYEMGFRPSEIAKILGMTPAHVSARIHELRIKARERSRVSKKR